jgi:energy-coupling factor transporter ATP-binding protein EcfA2
MILASSDLDIRAHLGAFGISGDVALQPIGSLSGGQKVRMMFACACVRHPQVLLLDEPSNNLSPEAIEALISSLKSYQGALVIISHDQYLLRSVCKELMIVEMGTALLVRQLPLRRRLSPNQPSGSGSDRGSGSSNQSSNSNHDSWKGAASTFGTDKNARKIPSLAHGSSSHISTGDISFDELLDAYLAEM